MDSTSWESKKTEVIISETSIGATSSEKLALSVSDTLNEQFPRDDKWETFGLIAPIVDFMKDGSIPNEIPYPKLGELLDDGPSKIMNDLRRENSVSMKQPAFRWIHVPINKMDWVQVC
jgi:hypothetical protein